MTGKAKLIGCVSAICLAALVYHALIDREPSYHGVKLKTWLVRLREDSSLNSPNAARDEHAIRQIGTNAFPLLWKMTCQKESPIRERLLDLLPYDLRWRMRMFTVDQEYDMAIDAVIVLGPILEPTVPFLVAKLNDRDPNVRIVAVGILGAIGPGAHAAVGPLTRIAGGKEGDLKGGAIDALGKIHSEAAGTIPVLTRLLDDPLTSEDNQIGALLAISNFNALAQIALPSVRRYLTNSNIAIRNYSTNVFNAIGGRIEQ